MRIGDCGFDIDMSKEFKPKCICIADTQKLFVDMPESLRRYAKELFKDKGWRIYVVDQRRGTAYCTKKVITIPLWATRKEPIYKAWYIAHELAHAFAWLADKRLDQHGPRFMSWLIQICPPESIHFELEYKPRNAAAAGITKPVECFKDGSMPLKIREDDWL